MADTTDPKVAVLTIWNTYWTQTSIANLPANVGKRSSGSDEPIQPIEAVVGDVVNTSDEWMNGTEKLYKYTLDLHTYVRNDDVGLNDPTMATLKKQRTAINNNIRTIMELNPFRPTSDVFQILAKTRAVDRDMRNLRRVILHSIQQCEVWIVEAA